MFDNPKKELEALEKKLLEDEAWFEKELDSAKRMIGQNPQKPPRAPQAPKRPAAAAPAPKTTAKTAPAPAKASAKQGKQPEKAPAAPKKDSIRGLLILAAVETLGILGLIAYWIAFLL